MEGDFSRLRDVVTRLCVPGGGRVSVFWRGFKSTDFFVGHMDKLGQEPWTDRTLTNGASCTKAVTNIAVAILVDRNLLSYDEKVSKFWPEFAQKGKDEITVTELLTHRAALPYFDELIDFPISVLENPGKSTAWNNWIDFLARQPMVKEAQNQLAYHAITVGFYVSVLIWKITGKTAKEFVEDEICRPFAITFFMGGEVDETHLARIVRGVEPKETVFRNIPHWAPRTFQPMKNMASFFPLRRCESPAHIGYTNAKELAFLLQLAMTGRLFSAKTWQKLTSLCVVDQLNVCGGENQTYSTGGFQVERAPNGNLLFGHNGFGGHFCFADPTIGLSFAFTTNAHVMETKPRRDEIIATIYECLEKKKMSKM